MAVKNHVKKTKRFISDCPELVNRINEKEFQRKDIFKIINYYNDNCSQKEINEPDPKEKIEEEKKGGATENNSIWN